MTSMDPMKKQPEFNNNLSPQEIAETDSRLKELFNEELPAGPENPWFNKKVMNRLPEKKRIYRWSFLRIVFYAIAFIGLMAAWFITSYNATTEGFTSTNILCLIFLPLVTIFCAAAIAIPVIKREIA